MSSLAAFLISLPDSPMFLPNLGRRLPPKRTSRTTAMIRISGHPMFLNMFFLYKLLISVFYSLLGVSFEAALNSLIAEEIPLISSGSFLVPKRAITTTAIIIISVVPMLNINLGHPLSLNSWRSHFRLNHFC